MEYYALIIKGVIKDSTAFVHVCARVCVCACGCVPVHMHVCVHVCACAHMCACICRPVESRGQWGKISH